MMTRWYSGLPYVKPQFSEFIILVKTDNTGVSASNEILLPIQGSNMIIDWGDGNVSIHTQTLAPNNTIGGANVTHTYASAGGYQIKISPRLVVGGDGLHRVLFNNGGDRLKLLEINNWGKCIWSSMENAFRGCSNFDCLAIDLPNFSTLTNTGGMFMNCTNFRYNEIIDDWDMSNVTSLGTSFNDGMFRGCSNFNQSLKNWNISKVVAAQGLFMGCTSLSKLDVSNWDVSKMFRVIYMFAGCSSLQTINVSNWNTSSFRELRQLFAGCSSIQTLDTSNWVIANLASNDSGFLEIFFGCTNLQNVDVTNWDVSTIPNFSRIFQNCSSLVNIDLSNWNTSNVNDYSFAFSSCNLLQESLGTFVIRSTANLGGSNQMLSVSNTTFGTNLQEWYSRTLIGWANNIFSRGGVVTGRSLGAGNRRYNNINYVSGEQFNNAVDARDYLVNTLGWTITGDAQV
jgi:surface protein